MTTLREKRHRQCLDSIGRLTEQREHAFRRLAILHNRLADERRRLARLQKELPKRELKLQPVDTSDIPETGEEFFKTAKLVVPVGTNTAPGGVTLVSDPDLSIPDFLRRGPLPKDAVARAEIEAEQAARKAVKTKARIAKMKANLTDETRRMPLTGKAALKRIREG